MHSQSHTLTLAHSDIRTQTPAEKAAGHEAAENQTRRHEDPKPAAGSLRIAGSDTFERRSPRIEPLSLHFSLTLSPSLSVAPTLSLCRQRLLIGRR